MQWAHRKVTAKIPSSRKRSLDTIKPNQQEVTLAVTLLDAEPHTHTHMHTQFMRLRISFMCACVCVFISFFTSTVCDRRIIFSASFHFAVPKMYALLLYCSIVCVALINLFASNVVLDCLMKHAEIFFSVLYVGTHTEMNKKRRETNRDKEMVKKTPSRRPHQFFFSPSPHVVFQFVFSFCRRFRSGSLPFFWFYAYIHIISLSLSISFLFSSWILVRFTCMFIVCLTFYRVFTLSLAHFFRLSHSILNFWNGLI